MPREIVKYNSRELCRELRNSYLEERDQKDLKIPDLNHKPKSPFLEED